MRTQPSEKTKINLNTMAQTLAQRAGSRNRYAGLYMKAVHLTEHHLRLHSVKNKVRSVTFTMKSLSPPAVSKVSILLIFYISYSWARSYQVKFLFLILQRKAFNYFMFTNWSFFFWAQEIHHLLTDDERELIFGHPSPEYGKKMISIKAMLS